jgi:hypothetical protein
MAYQPVQRNAGEIMYNAAMRRAQTLGGAFDTAVNTMYERQEENKAFNSKLKALESMIQTHSTKFGMDPDQLKQFLSVNPNESPKERYLRIGGFFEGTLKAAELQKMQLANQKAQTEIDQLKKLGDIYASFGAPTSQAPAAGPAPAPAVPATAPAGTPPPTGKYRRVDGSAPATPAAPALGTSEMSLLNSLRRFSPQQDTGYGMFGAEPFRLPSQMAAPAAPAAASAMASQALATPAQPAAQAPAPAAEQPAGEGIPRPKIPSWYETLKTPMEIAAETAGAPGEMDLSPEAQAIARQLREQYEASLPVEEGKSPKKSISAADGRKGAQKGITLDAETLRAIIQDPRILMQLRAGRRVDGLIEDRQQLRALQEMMLPRRSR